MDIETELRQLELMAPRHDNLYSRILDWMDEEIESAKELATMDMENEWRLVESQLEHEIESLKDENETLKDELHDKNSVTGRVDPLAVLDDAYAEIDRLVALVDSLGGETPCPWTT